MDWIAVTSRMGKRIAAVLALCAAVPLLLFAIAAAREANSAGAAVDELRLSALSSQYADLIKSRLGVAETLLETFTARDPGTDGSMPEYRLANSRIFKSAVVANRNGPLAGGQTSLRPSAAQFVALGAGQTIIMPVMLEGQLTATYMVRAVSWAGVGKLAYFELSPEWLWKDLAEVSSADIIVVDADGRALHSPRAMSGDTNHMFAERIALLRQQGQSLEALSWLDRGSEWHGILKHVPLINERITTAPWAVVAYSQHVSFFARSRHVWTFLPVVILVLIACVLVATRYLARGYLPVFKELRAGLPGLQTRSFEPLKVTGLDEPRDLITAFNRCSASLQEQFHALETLGEIDKLLLGSADLEHVLEGILCRVQAVTRCVCVGITLRDADAPGRGRVYLSTDGKSDLPVTRVELDDGMLTTLMTESNGLTVARCEETRHSFLRPMKNVGAEFFWVWPVNVSDRVEAILAVGYREAPAADPYLARSGGQFAERLAVALSKNMHDEQLYRQAHFDPLTSLPNRLLFRDRLAQEIANATAGLSRGALLYIDLDHFKRVNDSVGHIAGDQMLVIVAQRLRSCVKDCDTVARLAGDEFTVILRNVADSSSARTVAERVIASLQMPVNIGGRDHFVSASIGITLFPDDGSTIEDVMRNADNAMYGAKDLGRGRTLFFDPQMNSKAAVPTDSGLHRALRRREFSLFYQPQFSIAHGELAGLEALLRWQTAREGVRQPNDFVPAAEESGLIVDIGGWVLDAACAQLASWRDQNIGPPRVALNVSAQQLRHTEFARLVRRALDKYGLDPSLLELELTESVFADETTGAVIERLHQIGVQLTLDGFGSGYSSLSYLRQYPITTLKIDRTFLEDVPQNLTSATLVETVVVMAHALGKRVVAEGIETSQQLDFLRARQCDIAQGFFLARPLSAQAATELLQARAQADSHLSDVRAAG